MRRALGARNGGTFETLVTGLSAGTWYDIWVVVDNAADTYDVYYGTSGAPNTLGTLIADDFSFRNGSAANDLVAVLALSNNQDDLSAHMDDIQYSAEIPGLPDLQFGDTLPVDGSLDAEELPELEALIYDAESTVDTSSIVLRFDDAEVAYSLAQSGGTSEVSYAVTEALTEWSVHTAQVFAASVDGAGCSRIRGALRSAEKILLRRQGRRIL